MTPKRAVLAAIWVTTVALTAAGCTTAVEGMALPAEPRGPTTATTPTSAAPSVVSATVLEGLLLTPEQIVALVGGTVMAPVGTIAGTSDSAEVIDDRTCVGLGSLGDVAIYSNSGWVAMRGNQLTSPDAVQADVTQLVTSFTTTADAAALLQRARRDWQGCANRRYGFDSSNGNHSYFDTGPVNGSGSRIEVLLRQEEDPRWACSHAMAVQKSIVAEGRVCLLNRDTTAAVNNLLDQVVARIPQ
ncbi:sensor domain-containing protein [Mycobacterium decipiens]|uniref:PknH-like extracellular domain-containing protein n=1 Tax=Mycobacterium decipiens TaxID=1430326 RepID=A0A1X2LUN8_9MYCO|nr:sensor domain-containing protein [Mycobacterium decipiens]OSC40638.1 hypothetical protein B8W66_12200 [Mycobacterium decipiens]